ncbi:MAG: glycerol kinase GlpK [Proteobacteria bacterium]|nr:glycerol kinase GlpK [Pseudomonadota bacterium]
MPQFILALDQGTTSSRSILFDAAGTPVATAQREFTQHFPRSGWVEHDAEEIWATQAATITEVLARARATPADVAAIGITNQRETTVLWDRSTGRPIAPAIVWQDRRTAALCQQLQADGLEPEVSRRTGLLLDPYFSGTKLAWLLDHVPGARQRAEDGELAFGTIDSWLVWKLSNGERHVTDVSNASRTLLLNVASAEWDDFMLERLRIPRAVLPQVVPSSLTRNAPVATLGRHTVPIAGIAGDQQAALFGQACFAPGMAKNTYGTGCFLLMNTGTTPLASSNRLLTTIAWRTTDLRYALEGAVFVGGAVVQWLRDGLGIIERSADIEALAASVPDAGGAYLVPAFTGLGSPHWDAYARGTMVGLSRGTTRAHIARAALEAIAFQSAEVLLAMQRDARQPLVELRVDGGATTNDLLMQFQADLLGVPVVRPRVTETTALGAAYLAGLGTGFWSSPTEVAANWRVERRFEPQMSRDEANARLARWAQAVDRSRGWHVES